MTSTPIEKTETGLAIEELQKETPTNRKETTIDFESLSSHKYRAKHNAHETTWLQDCFYDARHDKVEMNEDRHWGPGSWKIAHLYLSYD